MKMIHGTFVLLYVVFRFIAYFLFLNFHFLAVSLFSSCCASRFTWASTSDNEAQEARDKHNCRSCGSLVCEPCSSNRAPILSLGLNVAVRICDRCYNDIDGLLVAKPEISNDIVDNRSSREIDGSMQNTTASVKQKPSRKREKRSAVVDELAHRVQSSALKCCN